MADGGMTAEGAERLRFGDFVLEPARRVLLRGGVPVELRPKSFDLLVCLARNAGRVMTKDELMTAVWPGLVVTDESLTRCVSDVRAALGEAAPALVKTVPRRGYLFAAPQHASAAPRAPRRWAAALLAMIAAAAAALWFATRPSEIQAPALSLVVLPLQSRNGDAQQAYLAEALTDEITVDLSRIPDSFVIGRSTADAYGGRVDAREVGRDLGVRYVLGGSVERLGNAVRLSLQLVDARSGRALWADRFDGELSDPEALRRRITGTVAQSLQVRLVEAESERARRRPVADADARDLALRAWSLLRTHRPDEILAARKMLQQAVARDAQSAFAWGLLAESYALDVGRRNAYLRGATRSEWLRHGEEAADRAFALDPDNAYVLGARAYVLSLQGRAEEALTIVQRHLAINRNDPIAWFRLCYTQVTLGRQDDAIKACHEALRLSPQDAYLTGFCVVLAAAHLHLGDDAGALEWARKSALAQPGFSVPRSWIASAAANLGDMETAHAALAEFRRLQPNYTVASFRNERLCANAVCERQRERYYAGLLKAGLPE